MRQEHAPTKEKRYMSVPKNRLGSKSSLLPAIETGKANVAARPRGKDSMFLDNQEIMDYYKRSLQRSNAAVSYVLMELDPLHPAQSFIPGGPNLLPRFQRNVQQAYSLQNSPREAEQFFPSNDFGKYVKLSNPRIEPRMPSYYAINSSRSMVPAYAESDNSVILGYHQQPPPMMN